MFLSRYAPIYTKGGVNGGVFLVEDYRSSILLYLSVEEEAVLYRVMAMLSTSDRNIVANILYRKPLHNPFILQRKHAR